VLYFGDISAGEGIAGQAGIAIVTTAMRGSIGIVLLTRHFSYGGLYHCPASGILNTDVQAAIRQMLHHVSPSIVVITPGLAANQLDQTRVKNFVKLTWPAAEIGIVGAATTASLHWMNGKPQLNKNMPAGLKPRSAPESMRNADFPSRRDLLGGVLYYGGRMAVNEPGRAVA